MSRHVLKSARLTLRPLTEADLPEMKARLFSEPEVVKTLLGDISTLEALEAQARLWLDGPDAWAQNGFGAWGVYSKDSVLLGLVAADQAIAEIGQGPEIFYLFAPTVWGKGVGSEATALMCNYLFEVLEQPALEALIFAELNPGSVRLAEKLGMTLVGRVPIVGHHLTEARARETQAFDLWRLETAAPDQAARTLEETAFRIGQFLGEGIGSRDELTEALIAVAGPASRQIVEQRVAAGMASPGMAHYRVSRAAYRTRVTAPRS
ncbi:MAG: GNAT family N-acetyltransferase [Pseudomonadota bacterium]